MNKDEALRMALDAMQYADACLRKQLTTKVKHEYAQDLLLEATKACKEALAQPEREWVGLTDEEIDYCVKLKNPEAVVEEVEAKLKQKNGYAEEKKT